MILISFYFVQNGIWIFRDNFSIPYFVLNLKIFSKVIKKLLNVCTSLFSSLIIVFWYKKMFLAKRFFKKSGLSDFKNLFCLWVFYDQVEKNNPFLIRARDWYKSFFVCSIFFFILLFIHEFTLFALACFCLFEIWLFRTDIKSLLKSENSALFTSIFSNSIFISPLNESWKRFVVWIIFFYYFL